jgi:hypothetical protein
MGWLNYLVLGDLGQQLDIGALDARLNELRASQRGTDRGQDERIARLEEDVQDLRLRFVTLLRVLRRAGVLSAADIAELVGDIRAERGG